MPIIKNGDFQAAENHFRQSLESADPGLTPKLHYNLGNSAFRQGKLEEAIDHYHTAIDLAPDDTQAKENLEFVEKQLQKQQERQKNQGDTSSKENQEAQDNTGQPNKKQGQQDEDNPQKKQQPPQDDQEHPPQTGGPEERQGGPTPEQQDQQSQAAGQPKPQQQQSPSAADQVLQRLKDEPGRALMPNYQKRRVKEDW